MVVLMAIIAASVTSELETDAVLESSLLGWGLGLEMPILGVAAGFGSSRDVRVGYTFGGAIDYELTPSVDLRLLVQYTKTLASRANVALADAGGQSRVEFDANADYLSFQSSLGARYAFVGDRSWAPYVGFDAGLVYGRYDYNITPDATSLRSAGNVGSSVLCEIVDCQTGRNDSNQLTWSAGARAGLQFQLAPWLRSAVDISVDYTPFNTDTITNTVPFRNVTSVDEDITLVRINYTARWRL